MSSEKDQVTLAMFRTESAETDMLELLLDITSENQNCAGITVFNFFGRKSIEGKIENAIAKAKGVSFKYDNLACRGYHLVEKYKGHEAENLEQKLGENIENSMAALSDAVIRACKSRKPLVLLGFPVGTADFVANKINGTKCEHVYWYNAGSYDSECHKRINKNKKILIKDFSARSISRVLSGQDCFTEYVYTENIQLLGLDVSMSNTGVAALAIIDSRETFLAGSLGSDKALDDFTRGRAAGEQLNMLPMQDVASDNKYLVDVSKCSHIAIEGGALGAAQGAYRLGRYCGLVVSHLTNLKSILEVPPTRLKKIITGYGFSEKSAVKKFTLAKLNLVGGDWLNEDESDALALLYCKINEKNIDFTSKKRPKKKTAKSAAKKLNQQQLG